MNKEFFRYVLSGIINTAIGYAVFLICLHVFEWKATTSNGASYAIGLLSAYMMNLMFVFEKSRHSIETIARFLAGFAIAYLINLAALEFFIRKIGLPAEIAQIFAMASYTISFYLINKHFIWKVK